MAGKISGYEFIKDIRVGVNREDLMDKYGVSPRRLEAMLNKVTAAGFLTKDELPLARPASIPPRVGAVRPSSTQPEPPPGMGGGKRPGTPGKKPGVPGGEASGAPMVNSHPPDMDNTPFSLGDAPVPINLNAFTAPGSEAHTPEKPVASKGPSRTSAMSPGAPPGAAYIIGGVVLIGVGFFKGGSVFMGSADFMGWFFDILGIFSICLGGCLELIRG